MASKFQYFNEVAPALLEYEGVITSGSNIRPDEIIFRNFGSKAVISIRFVDGKKMDLPLHKHDESSGTLIIPEKFYKEAEKETELLALLRDLFDNQRSLEVEILEENEQIVIQPIGKKNTFQFTFV